MPSTSSARNDFSGIFQSESQTESTPTVTNTRNPRPPTLNRIARRESVGSRTARADDSYDLFRENMLFQKANHQLQNDILTLQKQKLEITIQQSQVELSKSELAQIDVKKAKQLADIEIKAKKLLMQSI